MISFLEGRRRRRGRECGEGVSAPEIILSFFSIVHFEFLIRDETVLNDDGVEGVDVEMECFYMSNLNI